VRLLANCYTPFTFSFLLNLNGKEIRAWKGMGETFVEH